MIPLKDNIRPQRTPFINYLLMAVTAIVFLIQMQQGLCFFYQFWIVRKSLNKQIQTVSRQAGSRQIGHKQVRTEVLTTPHQPS